MDGIESFSEKRNWARVSAGFKGGPFNANPMVPQKMTFADGIQKEVVEAMQARPTERKPIMDAWNMRRSK